MLPGTRLVEAAAEAGIVLEAPCGGEGLCGKCRVIVASGTGEPTAAERDWLSAEELQAGWRLACQSAVCGPMEVEIPPVFQAAAEHKILVHAEGESGTGSLYGNSPEAGTDAQRWSSHKANLSRFLPVRKQYVELPPPTRGDDLPDLLRLERALDVTGGADISVGPSADALRGRQECLPHLGDKCGLEVPVSLLREIPARLRQAEFCGTAVLASRRLLDFEPGNTEAEALAVALDVGTTTLVGTLLDLGTGSQWAVNARLNPQTRFGDNVLSRILHARQEPAGLRQLHEAITAALDEMIGELCRQAGVPRDRVYEVTVAGNTTMQQLLAGVDPSPLGEVPFVPAGGRGLACLAADLGIHIHPRGGGYLMPVIGGFVGGDTVAGILATGLADAEKPTLLVDIGTNGEIVLAAGGKLSAASTAAGPAFEGARISCGMRGSTGAIEKVVVDAPVGQVANLSPLGGQVGNLSHAGRLRINVIGNVAPAGLCGSGLIDVAAELLRHGLLTPQGRLQTPDRLPASVLPDLARRVVLHAGQVSFLLASEAETADGRPIVLTQQDLRELQLAAGAIRAGIVILLRRAGLEPKDLDRVLIGGGFGNFIRRNNAQRIGLLPSQIEHRRIRFMGNTSLAGAQLVALSRRAREMAEGLARRTEHVDLSTDADFSRAFAEAMIFPEP